MCILLQSWWTQFILSLQSLRLLHTQISKRYSQSKWLNLWAFFEVHFIISCRGYYTLFLLVCGKGLKIWMPYLFRKSPWVQRTLYYIALWSPHSRVIKFFYSGLMCDKICLYQLLIGGFIRAFQNWFSNSLSWNVELIQWLMNFLGRAFRNWSQKSKFHSPTARWRDCMVLFCFWILSTVLIVILVFVSCFSCPTCRADARNGYETIDGI